VNPVSYRLVQWNTVLTKKLQNSCDLWWHKGKTNREKMKLIRQNFHYPPVASRNCSLGDQRMESTDFSWPRSMWVVEADLRSTRCTLDSPHATATRQCWVATDDMSWENTKLFILKSFTVCTHNATTWVFDEQKLSGCVEDVGIPAPKQPTCHQVHGSRRFGCDVIALWPCTDTAINSSLPQCTGSRCKNSLMT